MRWVLGLMAMAAAACVGDRTAPEIVGEPGPSPAAAGTLNPADLNAFVTVRSRALLRSEETLDRLERGEISPLAAMEDIASAERRAAALLGVEWRRYSAIREEVGRTITEQRRREDSRLLTLELERALEEMRNQRQQSRDAATREFVQAQISSLERHLARLELERELPPNEAAKREMLDRVRAELAMQAGRQERLQRRLRELLQAHGLGTLEFPAWDAPSPSP